MAEDRKRGSERFEGKDTGTRREDHRRVGDSGAGYDYRGDFGRGSYGAGADGGFGEAFPDKRTGGGAGRQWMREDSAPQKQGGAPRGKERGKA